MTAEDSKEDDGIICSFAQISVTKRGQETQKFLEGPKAVLQCVDKEIYVGAGNYKTTWKKVLSLRVNDDDDDDEDHDHEDENEKDIGDAPFLRIESDKHIFHAQEPESIRQWLTVRKWLLKRWNKQQTKEARKVQRSQEAERQDAAPTKRSYASKSYSKRSRASTFLLRNATNIKEWDSEDDEVFNRLPPKKARVREAEAKEAAEAADLEVPPTQEEEEEEDQGEQEANFDDDDDNVEHNSGDEDASLRPADDMEEEEDALPFEEEEEEEPKIMTKTKRRLFKSKQRNQDDDDSDDDDLFNNDGPALTTPTSANRIVSPATALRPDALADEDDEEMAKQEEAHEEIEDQKGLQNITNFFTRSVTSAATATKPKFNKAAATDKKLPSAAEESQEEEQDSVAETQEEAAPPKKQATGGFFAPRRPAPLKTSPKQQNSSSEESTVVASPTSTQLTEETDKAVSTPKSSKTKSYSFAYESAKKLEEEDPIVDSPSTAATINESGRWPGQKRLFKEKSYSKRPHPPPSTAKATMALELAEIRSPGRSPLAAAFSSSTKTRLLSPKKSPARRLPMASTTLVSATSRTPKKAPTTPTPIPVVPKWRGLRNFGNTCYMNASLQMLFSVPTFVQALGASKAGRKLVPAICNLAQDLGDQKTMQPGSATARAIKTAIDDTTDKFRGYHQRDAHEFLGDLLDQIHEERDEKEEPLSKKNENEDEKKVDESSSDMDTPVLPTDDFFRLNVEVCLNCKSCGYSRTKEEMYRYLSIDINADETEDNGDSSVSQKRTVEKCLEHFFKPEDREIKCEKCDDGQVATQTMRVLSRPKAMLLHLKRFVLEEKPREDNNNAENQAPNTSPGMTFRKNKAPVELTQRLSLDRFLAKKEDAAGKNYYSLKSIVHHIGSTADSGHYTADALRKSQDDSQSGTWVSFDDGLTNETTSTKVRNSVQNQKTAYMLLYSTV